MINGLLTLRNSLKSFNLQKEQYAILEENKDVISDLQAEVLAEGKDRSGRVRDDFYSDFTVRYKQEFGQGLGKVTDRVTFYMTGAMYQSFFTYLSKRTYEVRSPLERWDKMIERIGKENYGLDYQRRMKYFEEVNKPRVIEILFVKTGLRF
jgi:hypothetical protein